MSSIAVMSRMRVNPNHFLPKSLIEAPMWYTNLSDEQCALPGSFAVFALGMLGQEWQCRTR